MTNVDTATSVEIPIEVSESPLTVTVIAECASGEYYFADEIGCHACSEDCQQCSSLDECEECVEGFYQVAGSCVSTSCEAHSFFDYVFGECSECDVSCATCLTSTNSGCETCSEGYWQGDTICAECPS